jgi:hypothetical protein
MEKLGDGAVTGSLREAVFDGTHLNTPKSDNPISVGALAHPPRLAEPVIGRATSGRTR